MTRHERDQWLSDLARTPRQQHDILVDLLNHAHEDEMSAEDRVIVVEELARLKEQVCGN